jgi:hypothetical protein
MAGFRNTSAWATAVDSGKTHVVTFRKTVASAATVANDFIDYTYFAGNPPANFYASSPLEAAYVESIRGIQVPVLDDGSKQFLKSITAMSAASSATSTTNQNQRHMLADYLLYYPFIDTDAVGEQQDMVQTVSLPTRYTSGQVMCVAQSASSTVGRFTITYTNQDGVGGRVSQNTFTKVVSGGGTLVSSTTSAVAGSQPFVELQTGDSGVQSIESVTFTAAGGGLMALVIVKPLFHFLTTQEARRTTTGNLDSFGSATYYETVLQRNPVEIKPNAVLGVIGLGNAGSLASSALVGALQTIWS